MNTHVKIGLGVIIILIFAITAGVFVWYAQKNIKIDSGINQIQIKPSNKTKCVQTSDCKLTYTGPLACPCDDYGDDEYRCLLSTEAEVIEDAFIQSRRGAQCEVCPPEEINFNFECVCNSGICEKTEKIDFSNWQTYRNKKYGFEFKYPKNWKLTIIDNNSAYCYLNLENNDMPPYDLCFAINYKSDIEKEINKTTSNVGPEMRYQEIKNYMINNHKAEEYYHVSRIDGHEDLINIDHNEIVYSFSFPSAEDNPNYNNPVSNNRIARQILSTFKFIDSAIGNISENLEKVTEWKTFRNKEHKIEFKYPANWVYIDSKYYGTEAPVDWWAFRPSSNKLGPEYSGDVAVEIKENPQKLNLTDYFNGTQDANLFKDSNNNYIEFRVDGHEAIRFKNITDAMGVGDGEIVVINSSEEIVVITALKNFEVREKILSTLKFIN